MPSPTERTTPSARIHIEGVPVRQEKVDEALARGLDASAVMELAVHQCLDPTVTTGAVPTSTRPLYLPVSKEQWDTVWVPAIRVRGLDVTEFGTLGLYRYLEGAFVLPRATRSTTPRDAHKTSARFPDHLWEAVGHRMEAEGVLPKPARVVSAFLLTELAPSIETRVAE